MMTRFLSVLAILGSLAAPANAQLPDITALLALLPQECLLTVQTTVIPCFIANPECLEDLPTADEIGSLPSSTEIDSCDDVSGPVCPILERCELCLDELGELLTCILVNSENISQEITDLINGCVFDCEGGMIDIGGGMNMTDDNVTDAPVASPVDAPTGAAPTGAADVPTGTPSDMGMGTPAPSTAAKTVTLGVVGAVAVLSSFLLA